MTSGGPGFTTDVIASVIYKQYQAGFYGLSTAGNVILSSSSPRSSSRCSGSSTARRSSMMRTGAGRLLARRASSRSLVVGVVFLVPFAFIVLTAVKNRQEAALLDFSWPTQLAVRGEPRRCSQARDYMLRHRLHQQHDPHRRQRGDHGRASPRWSASCCSAGRAAGPAGQLPGPGRADHPARGRADHLGAAEHRPVQDAARADPVEVAFGLSFCILLFRAFVATIPRELDEAAIDRRRRAAAAVLPGRSSRCCAGRRSP